MPPRLFASALTRTTTYSHPLGTRSAHLIRRPLRPTHFPQLVILSDGSVYTQLTTSPRGVYRTTKDSRNHPLWNPSVGQVKTMEEDEAGRLKAFREKFGAEFEESGDFMDIMGEGWMEDKAVTSGKVEGKKKREKK